MLPEDIAPLHSLNSIPADLAQSMTEQGSCEVNAVLIGNDINLKALMNRASPRKETVMIQLSEKSLAIMSQPQQRSS